MTPKIQIKPRPPGAHPRALAADWEGSECVDSGVAESMKYVVVFAAMDDASEAAVKYAAAQHTAKAE